MSSVLSGLLGTIGGIANPIMGIGGLVSGLLGSLAGGRQTQWQRNMAQNQLTMGMQGAQNLQGWQQFMQNMAQNPATFMQNALKMAPSLNANLVQQANTAAANNSALAGMGQSPGSIEAASTQMLGPEMQQNTLAAMQQYGNLLQQPGQLDQMLMNWGNNGQTLLPPPTSGAGGFATFQNAYNSLPQAGARYQNYAGPMQNPITFPPSGGGFDPGSGIPNINNSPIDLTGIGGGMNLPQPGQ
jgi:hypothetical protein